MYRTAITPADVCRDKRWYPGTTLICRVPEQNKMATYRVVIVYVGLELVVVVQNGVESLWSLADTRLPWQPLPL